jgi:hypothetical protein
MKAKLQGQIALKFGMQSYNDSSILIMRQAISCTQHVTLRYAKICLIQCRSFIE